MNTATLLNTLQQQDIKLSVAGTDTLDIDAPEDTLTPELAQEIRAHKQELLHLLGTVVTEQLPSETRQVTMIDHKPLICHKCLNTNPDDFKLNLLRSRWICCNCGEPSHRVFFLPEPATPGDEVKQLRQEITEMIRAGHSYKESEQGVSVQSTMPAHSPIPRQEPTTEPLPVVRQATQERTSNMKSIHCAVLHNNGLTWLNAIGQLAHAKAEPSTFEDIAELAIEHNIRNVWITPGCTFSEYVFDHPNDFLTGKSTDHKSIIRTREYDKQEYPTLASVNRLTGTWNERRIIYIYLPQMDNRWADDKVNGWTLADVENPKVLLAALTYLHTALGVDIGAPGHTGIELMKLVNNSLARAVFVQAADLTMLPDHREVDLQFCCELTEQENEGTYLHIYDRNSMYLAATTGAEMGEGTPEHVESNIDTLMEWEQHPTGVWHITVTAPKTQDERLMRIVEQFIDEGKQWVYTPAIDALLSLGYTVEFHEAWIWRKTHRTLQPWGKLLWDTRQALRNDRERFPNEPGAETARQMLKRIATQGVGWLDLQSDRKRVPTPQWHRFDMKNLIVSLARFRMVLKILECIKLGYYPVLGYTDGIGFISNESNPALAVPGLMIVQDKQGVQHDRSTELGGFKCEHTFTMDSELRALFNGKRAPYEVKQALNKRGENNG